MASGWKMRLTANTKQAQQALKEFSNVTKTAGKTQKRLRFAFLGAATAMGVATKRAIDYGDYLERTSHKTGLATHTLSEYKLAAELAGTSQAGLVSGLQRLQKNMGAALRSPTSASAIAFKNLGLEFQNTDGSFRDLNDLFPEFAERMSKMKNGTLKTQIAMDLMGRSGAELIPILNQGAEKIRLVAEESAAMGVVWDTTDAVAAAHFNDALIRLKTTLNGLIQVTVKHYLPTFLDIAEGAVLATRAVLKLDMAEKRRTAVVDKSRDAIIKSAEGVEAYRNALDASIEVEKAAATAGTQGYAQKQRAALALAHEAGLLNNLGEESAAIVARAAREDAGFNVVSGKKVAAVFKEFRATVDLNTALEERIKKGKRLVDEMGKDAGISRDLLGDIEREKAAQEKAARDFEWASGADARRKLEEKEEEQAQKAYDRVKKSLLTEKEARDEALGQRLDAINEAARLTVISEEQAMRDRVDVINDYVQEAAAIDTKAREDADKRSREALEQENARLQKHYEEGAEMARQRQEERARLVEQEQAAQVDAAVAIMDGVSQLAGKINEMVAQTYGANSKEAKEAARATFMVQQAMALGQAAVLGAVALQQAAASGPPPFNAPAIAAQAAIVGFNVATIMATTVAGVVADAGLPPGALRAAGFGEHTTVMMRRDEMILDRKGTAAISRMLEGGSAAGQPVTVNTTLEIDGRVLGHTVDNHLIRSKERGIGYADRIRYGTR